MRFMYAEADGRVWIICAAPKKQLERVLGPLTDAQYRAHVIERHRPISDNWAELPADWVPPDDRTFRNAWVRAGLGVEVDMPKARELHRDRMRRTRAPKLVSLDVEYMRADEMGDTQRKTEITILKQGLRDVTDDPEIDAAKTPDELKAVWPEVLR